MTKREHTNMHMRDAIVRISILETINILHTTLRFVRNIEYETAIYNIISTLRNKDITILDMDNTIRDIDILMFDISRDTCAIPSNIIVLIHESTRALHNACHDYGC